MNLKTTVEITQNTEKKKEAKINEYSIRKLWKISNSLTISLLFIKECLREGQSKRAQEIESNYCKLDDIVNLQI